MTLARIVGEQYLLLFCTEVTIIGLLSIGKMTDESNYNSFPARNYKLYSIHAYFIDCKL